MSWAVETQDKGSGNTGQRQWNTQGKGSVLLLPVAGVDGRRPAAGRDEDVGFDAVVHPAGRNAIALDGGNATKGDDNGAFLV